LQLLPLSDSPPWVADGDGDEHCVRARFVEFFASNIRNRHTRRAYAHAVGGAHLVGKLLPAKWAAVNS